MPSNKISSGMGFSSNPVSHPIPLIPPIPLIYFTNPVWAEWDEPIYPSDSPDIPTSSLSSEPFRLSATPAAVSQSYRRRASLGLSALPPQSPLFSGEDRPVGMEGRAPTSRLKP